MKAVRWFPGLALLVLLALLPVEALYRAARPDVLLTNPSSGITDVTWAATVGPDGDIAVDLTYAVETNGPIDVDIRLPPNARQLRVDGRPVAADIGRYAEIDRTEVEPIDGPFTVSYVLSSHVVRYTDGALLRIGGIDDDGAFDADDSLLRCVACYIGDVGPGAIALKGAVSAAELDDRDTMRVAFGDLDQIRGEVDADIGSGNPQFRFVGVMDALDAPTMLLVLPESAVPDLPVTEGSADTAFDAARAELADNGLNQSGIANDPPIPELTTAVVLIALMAATAVWMLRRLTTAWRSQRDELDAVLAAPPADAPHEPPSQLEPAIAALMVGETRRDDRCPVAGTILAMARDGTIRIDGIDSQRFTLRLPAGTRGRTPTEEAVLTELRPQGNVDATATLTGPPLWGTDNKAAYVRILRVAVKSAQGAGLMRLTLSALVLVPLALAIGLVALIGSAGQSTLAWVVVFAGPVLAVAASILTGYSRTRAGRAEQERWSDYARWLRTNLELAEVGAPGIAIWGPVLPEAAAIGAAPVASQALSPRP